MSIVILVMKEFFFTFNSSCKNSFQGIKTIEILEDPLLFLFLSF